jgi:hypothetical protein
MLPPPALQYERQQLARAEHYARRPQSLKSQLWGRSHRSDPGSIGAAHAQQVRPRIASLMKNNRHRARRPYGHTTNQTLPDIREGYLREHEFYE